MRIILGVLLAAFTTVAPAAATVPDVLESAVTISAGDSQGSGFFISADEVMTAQHVIGDMSTVTVTAWDGQQSSVAEVTERSESCDVAVLKVASLEGTPLKIAPTATTVGQAVYAVGSPIGRPVLSAGTVTEIAPWTISTSVPVDFGSSGGALTDARGEVIGVVTRKDSDGNAFAVPIARAEKCLSSAQDKPAPVAQQPAADTQIVYLAALALLCAFAALVTSIVSLRLAMRKRRPIVITLDSTD